MDIENFLRNIGSSIREMGNFYRSDFISRRAGLVDKLPQLGKASLAGKAKRRKLCRVVLREPGGAVNPFTLEDLALLGEGVA